VGAHAALPMLTMDGRENKHKMRGNVGGDSAESYREQDLAIVLSPSCSSILFCEDGMAWGRARTLRVLAIDGGGKQRRMRRHNKGDSAE
jgi:hypothetical protein